MPIDRIQKVVIILVVVIFAASGIGYLIAPSKMLSIVGIVSTLESDFLIRTLAAALLALVPAAWAARIRDGSTMQRSILIGLAGYMFLSSAVDFHAYLNEIVGIAAVPSVVFRVALGGVLVWLSSRK